MWLFLKKQAYSSSSAGPHKPGTGCNFTVCSLQSQCTEGKEKVFLCCCSVLMHGSPKVAGSSAQPSVRAIFSFIALSLDVTPTCRRG